MPRYTQPTTPNQLDQLIQQIIQKNQDLVDCAEHLIIGSEECIGGAPMTKDLRSKFDFENVLTKDHVDANHALYTMMGAFTLQHLTLQGFLIGQDYGTPFYVVLYRGEKGELRAYIPKKGNAINPFSGFPFGEDQVQDDHMARKLGYADYASMDFNLPSVQYQFYDKTLLIHDIMTRIQLKP